MAVLRAVEGCKGVADAALPAAACAVASKWQKLAIMSKNEMPSSILHPCMFVHNKTTP